MPQGTIKRLVADRGFGFISAASGDIFFHHRWWPTTSSMNSRKASPSPMRSSPAPTNSAATRGRGPPPSRRREKSPLSLWEGPGVRAFDFSFPRSARERTGGCSASVAQYAAGEPLVAAHGDAERHSGAFPRGAWERGACVGTFLVLGPHPSPLPAGEGTSFLPAARCGRGRGTCWPRTTCP